jgi:hypothetical protein
MPHDIGDTARDDLRKHLAHGRPDGGSLRRGIGAPLGRFSHAVFGDADHDTPRHSAATAISRARQRDRAASASVR